MTISYLSRLYSVDMPHVTGAEEAVGRLLGNAQRPDAGREYGRVAVGGATSRCSRVRSSHSSPARRGRRTAPCRPHTRVVGGTSPAPPPGVAPARPAQGGRAHHVVERAAQVAHDVDVEGQRVAGRSHRSGSRSATTITGRHASATAGDASFGRRSWSSTLHDTARSGIVEATRSRSPPVGRYFSRRSVSMWWRSNVGLVALGGVAPLRRTSKSARVAAWTVEHVELQAVALDRGARQSSSGQRLGRRMNSARCRARPGRRTR